MRARVDGRVRNLAEPLALEPRRNHRIDVIVDRVVIRPGIGKRLRAGLEKALTLARDIVLVSLEGGGERLYSRRHACVECDVSVGELSPRAFSFNSPYGACPGCQGLGHRWEVDPAKVIPDESRTVLEGPSIPAATRPRLLREALEDVAKRQLLARGAGAGAVEERPARCSSAATATASRGRCPTETPAPERLVRMSRRGEEMEAERRAGGVRRPRPYLSETCAPIAAAPASAASLAVRVGGRSLADYVQLPVAEARVAFESLEFSERERPVADRLLHEILSRLRFLESVGVGYLSLDRPTTTLSAGEAHRIRLAGQIGARMQGILYVLDEPSVGLHQRDNRRLLETLQAIRDRGNTVVVVEHDEETIRAADWVVDLGEGAGRNGGRLMYQGPPGSIDGSLTGRYLRGELRIEVPSARPTPRAPCACSGPGAQPAGHRRRDRSASSPRHRREQGASRPRGRHPAAGPARRLHRAAPSRAPPGARGRGRHRQGHRHRPEPHRAHAALQPPPTEAFTFIARCSAWCQAPAATSQGASRSTSGRALRGVPGRRRAHDRHALPARRP